MENASNANTNTKQEEPEVLLSSRVLPAVICDRDYIPIDCMVVADRDHPNADRIAFDRPWDIGVNCMLEAIDFDTMEQIFNLKEADEELDVALRDALIFFLRNLDAPKADASSLMIGSLKRFLKSHPDFKKFFHDLNDD